MPNSNVKTNEELLTELNELIKATTDLLASVNISKETLDKAVNDSYDFSVETKGYADAGLVTKNETNVIKNETTAIRDETLEDATTLKNQTVSETTAIKNSAVSETTKIKTDTKALRDTTLEAKEETITAKDEAIAVVYEGEASLDPAPGKIPIARGDGVIGSEWFLGKDTQFNAPLIQNRLLAAGKGDPVLMDVSEAGDGSVMREVPYLYTMNLEGPEDYDDEGFSFGGGTILSPAPEFKRADRTVSVNIADSREELANCEWTNNYKGNETYVEIEEWKPEGGFEIECDVYVTSLDGGNEFLLDSYDSSSFDLMVAKQNNVFLCRGTTPVINNLPVKIGLNHIKFTFKLPMTSGLTTIGCQYNRIENKKLEFFKGQISNLKLIDKTNSDNSRFYPGTYYSYVDPDATEVPMPTNPYLYDEWHMDNAGMVKEGEGVFRREESVETATYMDRGVLKMAEVGQPRFETDKDGNPLGILIEGNTTNIISQSIDMTDSLWFNESFDGNACANVETVMGETIGVGKILKIEITEQGVTSGVCRWRSSITLPSENKNYTISVFVKAGNIDTGRLYLWGGEGNAGVGFSGLKTNNPKITAHFDSSENQVGISYFGKSWYRVWATVSNTVSVNKTIMLYVDDTPKKAGDFLYYTCPQVDELPFASSYIPTVGEPVTRNGDNLTIGSDHLPLAAEDYTLHSSFLFKNFTGESSSTIFQQRKSNLNYRWLRYVNVGSQMLEARSSMKSQARLAKTFEEIRKLSSLTMLVKGNNTKLFADNVLQIESTEVKHTTSFNDAVIAIGHLTSGTNPSEVAWGHIKDFRIWNYALSDYQISQVGINDADVSAADFYMPLIENLDYGKMLTTHGKLINFGDTQPFLPLLGEREVYVGSRSDAGYIRGVRPSDNYISADNGGSFVNKINTNDLCIRAGITSVALEGSSPNNLQLFPLDRYIFQYPNTFQVIKPTNADYNKKVPDSWVDFTPNYDNRGNYVVIEEWKPTTKNFIVSYDIWQPFSQHVMNLSSGKGKNDVWTYFYIINRCLYSYIGFPNIENIDNDEFIGLNHIEYLSTDTSLETVFNDIRVKYDHSFEEILPSIGDIGCGHYGDVPTPTHLVEGQITNLRLIDLDNTENSRFYPGIVKGETDVLMTKLPETLQGKHGTLVNFNATRPWIPHLKEGEGFLRTDTNDTWTMGVRNDGLSIVTSRIFDMEVGSTILSHGNVSINIEGIGYEDSDRRNYIVNIPVDDIPQFQYPNTFKIISPSEKTKEEMSDERTDA